MGTGGTFIHTLDQSAAGKGCQNREDSGKATIFGRGRGGEVAICVGGRCRRGGDAWQLPLIIMEEFESDDMQKGKGVHCLRIPRLTCCNATGR